MQRSTPFFLAVLILGIPAPTPAESLAATIETTLATDGEHIRQFAFDGDPKTFFVSVKNASRADHFTLVLDKPAAVKSLIVTTGRDDGRDKLRAGVVEASADGKKFEPWAKLKDGEAKVKVSGRKVRAIRIRPSEDLKYPLVVREIAVEAEPAVAIFKYPVEFVVDVSDAPEMKKWAEKAAHICERQYAMINEELKSDGFTPPRVVRMVLRKDYRGVAATSGGRITGSVSWFKEHPDDFGAMVHETVHVVQSYRLPDNPGWLVEGIADYIRFFKYEPGKIGPLSLDHAHYNGSYRVTAAFLAYLTDKYDKHIVRKLNKMMREGKYKEGAFKALTGKTLQELDKEWRATLAAKATK
jgi:hypothetical protein